LTAVDELPRIQRHESLLKLSKRTTTAIANHHAMSNSIERHSCLVFEQYEVVVEVAVRWTSQVVSFADLKLVSKSFFSIC
jgi:hypothetical protein